MKAAITKICQSQGLDCTVFSVQETTFILLLFPYRPFEPYPDGHLFLDAYYIASHGGYKKTTEVLRRLESEGYKFFRYRAHNLKDAVVFAGAASLCKNNLVYNKKYGSYFFISLLSTSPSEHPFPKAVLTPTACKRCRGACPGGALTDTGFEREKCIRQFMEKKPEDREEKERELIGERLIGCEICRQVCPKNDIIKDIAIPQEVLDATKKGSIDRKKIFALTGLKKL